MPPALPPAGPRELSPTAVMALVLAIVAFFVLVPYGPWLLMAMWFAALARRPLEALTRWLGGKRKAAAMMTVALFILVTAPLVVLGTSLVKEAIELGQKLLQGQGGKESLLALIAPSADGSAPRLTPQAVFEMAQRHGTQARELLSSVARSAANGIIGTFLFFWGAYALLVSGPEARRWFVDRLPLPRAQSARLGSAFVETGRGLLVGVGLTGLVQAALATITYAALGVPRPLVLGLFTLIASVIPSVGCGLVWAPVAVALAIAGHTTKAVILACVGAFVVSSVDNILRPIFARYGRLELPTYVLIVSMFGGLALLGGWGLLVGPLLVRLGKEGLDIARDEGLVGEPQAREPEAQPEAQPDARGPVRAFKVASIPSSRPRPQGSAAR